jgi:hypothetical protein
MVASGEWVSLLYSLPSCYCLVTDAVSISLTCARAKVRAQRLSLGAGNMWSHFKILIGVGTCSLALAGCSAESVEIKVSDMDINNAIAGKSETVPFQATFSVPGTLDDGQRVKLAALRAIVKKYVDVATFDTERGDFGTNITVEGSIPILAGDTANTASGAWLIRVDKVIDPSLSLAFPYSVQLATGRDFGKLDAEATGVDFMFSPDAVEPVKFRLRTEGNVPLKILAGGFEQEGEGKMISVTSIAHGESASLVFKNGAYSLVSGGFLVAKQ